MNELLHRLEDEGWEVSGEPLGDDLFYVAGEQVYWRLKSLRVRVERILVFQLCDYLGRRTDELRDVLYVEETTTHSKLYFDKIGSDHWKINLKEFVRSLY